MTTALAVIFVFGLLIFVHEFGHFLVGKKAGIKIFEFAFGMGPKIIGIQGKETLYSVRLFPIGGFVRFLSQEELNGQEDNVSKQELLDRSFESKTFGQKIAVMAAGAIMNFILGAILFIIVFAFFGVPVPGDSNKIGSIIEDRPAAAAGIEAGDQIISINGVETPDWNAVIEQIHSRPGDTIVFEIQKADTQEVVTKEIVPEKDPQTGQGMIGIVPEVFHQKVPVLKATQYGLQQTIEFTRLIIVAIVEMITGEMPVELGGPVAVAQVIGEGAKQGLANLLSLAGILSIQFGILNLLPIPALDGGQIAVLTYEGIRGKPLKPERKGLIQLTGFVLLMLLILAVTYQDIVKLVSK